MVQHEASARRRTPAPGAAEGEHGYHLVIACLLGLTYAFLVWAPAPRPLGDGLGWVLILDATVGLLGLGLVALWPQTPVPLAAALTALTTVSSTAVGPATIAVFVVAARRQAAAGVCLVAATGVCAALFEAWQPVPSQLTPAQVGAVTTIGAGLLLVWGRRRGHLAEALATERSRAVTAAAVQDRRLIHARAAERDRLATYLHDELGHELSRLAVAVDTAGHTDDDPVRVATRRTMTTFRAALDGVRDPAPPAGAPGASPVPASIRWRDVTCVVEDAAPYLPEVTVTDTVDVTHGEPASATCAHAVAVVREALTNCITHAPGAPIHVHLHGTPTSGVHLRAVNGPTARAAATRGEPRSGGTGIASLRRRAHAVGGTVAAGPDGDGWALDAWMPWTPWTPPSAATPTPASATNDEPAPVTSHAGGTA